MVNSLSQYVIEHAQRCVKGTLDDFVLAHQPPWIVDYKIDGRREFLFYKKGESRLATKHNGVYGPGDYPLLFKELDEGAILANELVLDCELVHKTQALYILDIQWWYEGITSKSLMERRAIIRDLISLDAKYEYVRIVPWSLASTKEQVLQLFEKAVKEGYEGVVVKTNSPYKRGEWLKMKKWDTFDVVIMSVKESDGYLETGEPWTWNIGVYNKGELVPIGSASSCVKEVDRSLIKPGTVIEVRAQEVTKNLRLRHPTILRVREDKIAEESLIDQLLPSSGICRDLH